MHTIPTYSHALFISEMVFESNHQPLKFALSRSTNPSAHLYAMRINLARDWLCRVAQLSQIAFNHTGEEGKRIQWAKNALFIFFGGETTREINWGMRELRDVKKDIEKEIRLALDGCILPILEDWYCEAPKTASKGGWYECNDGKKRAGPLQLEADLVMQTFMTDLEYVAGRKDGYGVTKVLFSRTQGATRSSYKHHSLAAGDAIEVLIDTTKSSERVLQPSENGEGSRFRGVIRALSSFGDSNSVWAAVSRFTKVHDGPPNLHELQRFTTQT